MEYIWIDAPEFDSFGGFIKETQFVREMGQPYLMADGVGEPVKEATVKFKTKDSGYYRFFIRTKNWIYNYKPDGLMLEVDGVMSEHVCSKMNVQGWYFEIGGDFKLQSGEHTLKVHNTDGWFGRFACVVITNDYDFTPSPQIEMLKKQRNKIKGIKPQICNKGSFDLIVAGAGVAGITAAITAARYGLKTALINDRTYLGGNGSIEGSVTLEGAAHRGHHETGIIYEIKNVRENEHIPWSDVFERFVSKEKNLSVFSNMLILNAETENNNITEIYAVSTEDLNEHKFNATMYVDGTGDGWLGYYAGASYRIGREADFQHNEEFAPSSADGNTMSGCATRTVTDMTDTICSYFAEDCGEENGFIAPDWALKLPEGDALGRKPEYIDRGHWWLEMPNDYDDVWESEFVRDSMFRMATGYFHWLKNSWEHKERAKSYKLKALGTYNAKRESRRLIGDYILTENDYDGNANFEDAVCYSGWNIDVHHVKGIFSGAEGEFTLNRRVPITPIPLRCLYSKNIDNLFMVGRCISVSHIGLGPVRVQLTGATMGQAVATAAYLCKKYKATPREIGEKHIDELQQLLLKDGMSIPNVFNHDPLDLARGCTVTADSYIKGGEPQNVINGKTRLTDGDCHAWISKGNLPQSITLSLNEEKVISQVRITLEMPFDSYQQCFLPAPEPREMLADFKIEVESFGKWITVGEVSNNIQRLVISDFNPLKATKVRVTAIKAKSTDKAIIPEIRIY